MLEEIELNFRRDFCSVLTNLEEYDAVSSTSVEEYNQMSYINVEDYDAVSSTNVEEYNIYNIIYNI